jgi:hypothetical protein
MIPNTTALRLAWQSACLPTMAVAAGSCWSSVRWLAGSLRCRMLTRGKAGAACCVWGELEAMGWHRGVGAEAEEGALTGTLLDGKFALRNR